MSTLPETPLFAFAVVEDGYAMMYLQHGADADQARVTLLQRHPRISTVAFLCLELESAGTVSFTQGTRWQAQLTDMQPDRFQRVTALPGVDGITHWIRSIPEPDDD